MKKKLSKNKKEEYLCILCDENIEPICLSKESSHYRFNEWDFWITKNEKFWNRVTGEKGEGILFLVGKIKQTRKVDDERIEFLKSLK